MNIKVQIFSKKLFYFSKKYDIMKKNIEYLEEKMKDTKEEKKMNFQSLRKYMLADYCGADCGKCYFDLLYDEFVRIQRCHRKCDCATRKHGQSK